MPEKFEQKLHNALFEGINREPNQGSSTIVAYIPDDINHKNFLVQGPEAELKKQDYIPGEIVDDDDTFRASEQEIELEYDWAKPEKRTHDYPGSPGGIWITKATLPDGQELNVDKIPEELQKHLINYILDMDYYNQASHYQNHRE